MKLLESVLNQTQSSPAPIDFENHHNIAAVVVPVPVEISSSNSIDIIPHTITSIQHPDKLRKLTEFLDTNQNQDISSSSQ